MEYRTRPEITEDKVEQIRSIIIENPEWNRTRISQYICRLWGWQNPNGGLKDISCRDMLRELDKAARIKLPSAQKPSRSHGSADNVKTASFYADIKSYLETCNILYVAMAKIAQNMR